MIKSTLDPGQYNIQQRARLASANAGDGRNGLQFSVVWSRFVALPRMSYHLIFLPFALYFYQCGI